jgi:hypothetical protein
MRQTVVRYQAKPEMAQENQRFIEKVFEELRAKVPTDIRYLVLRLADGTFVHFAIAENEDGTNPLRKIEAFQAFQAQAEERSVEPPRASAATIIGNYRMLGA